MSHRLPLLFAFTACSACRIPYGDEEPSKGCDSEIHQLEPGHTVEGQDPQALLAPLYGTWRGPLAWRAGGSTALSVSVERDPDAPIYRQECTPPGARTSGTARLVTSDGALDETLGAAVRWTSPDLLRSEDFGYLALSFRYVAIDATTEADWRGGLAAEIPGIDRYGGAGILHLDLEHDLDTLQLVGGVLSYESQADATGQVDTFEVATWHVE